jgi:LAO/AO transport system kinase
MHPLAERVIQGDPRAAARAISWIENHHPEKHQLLKDLHPYTGKAYIVGITGSPGTGKSTLVDRLITYLREQDLSLGIVAVDPTSPFTGGAILGDRVRMQRHATDPKVFIRSMGTRGYLGGLARHSKEAVRVLDAYGCEVILVETVGVGQSELDIMNLADTTVVVLSPGGGDSVQAFKAGIMEIADVFGVNKGDLEGAGKLIAQISAMLDIVKHDAPWQPPVVKMTAAEDKGIDQLWNAILKHKAYLQASGEWEKRRQRHWRDEVEEIVEYELSHLVQRLLSDTEIQAELKAVEEGKLDPYTLANRLIETIRKGGENR